VKETTQAKGIHGFYNTGKATDPTVGTSFNESTNASDATDPIVANSTGRQHTDDKQ